MILVLRGVSLQVPEGGIVALLGANGAGKTTTLKAISNLLRAERGDVARGQILYQGKRVDRLTPNELVRRGIIQVMEGRRCFEHLTVEDNLMTGAYTRRDSKAAVRDDLDLVYSYFPHLKERRTIQAGYISGGEQQMLVIGRALLTNPRIMTIDEPSLGLAPNLVDRVYETLLELRKDRGLTLLIVEQSSERALKVADRLYVLRSGQIQLEGNAADLQDGEKVRQAYFGFEEGSAHEGEVAF